MSNWIFLSKDLKDPYMNDFAKGCNTKPVDSNTFDYDASEDPIVLRGILKKKFPNMEMISFGPTIIGPHSPDERLNIKSVSKIWKFLVALLKNLN